MLEANLEQSNNGNTYSHYILEYMNHTLAAADALGLDILQHFSVPEPNNLSNLNETYDLFRRRVDGYTVGVHIRNIRVGSSTSLPFDEAEKKRIRAYVTKIKDIVDASALETAKKEALMNRLNAFLAEVDRDRTSMQRFQDFVMAVARTTGDATEELEPAWKWVRMVAAIFGVRQDTENAKLPPPPKRIEKPKAQIPPPAARRNGTRHTDMNDDIPF